MVVLLAIYCGSFVAGLMKHWVNGQEFNFGNFDILLLLHYFSTNIRLIGKGR